MRTVLSLLLVVACGAESESPPPPSGIGSAEAGQSAKTALAIICDPASWREAWDGPPAELVERGSKLLMQKITNPEVRELLRSLPDTDPREREAKLHELSARHGFTCVAEALFKPVITTLPDSPRTGR